MLRIHFTAEDLARTTTAPTFGPFAETLFSVQAAQQRGDEALLGAWRTEIRKSLSPAARSLAALFPPRIWTLDLFTVVGQETTIEGALDTLLATPTGLFQSELDGLPSQWRLPSWVGGLATNDPAARRHLVKAVSDFHQVAVQPYWEPIRQHIESQLAVLGRTGGVDRLLATLHPDLRWRRPVLEISRGPGPSRDMYLGGRGLLLVPSLFRREAPPVFSTQADAEGPAVLFFPVPVEPSQAAGIWRPQQPTHRALVALLGQTRADVLAMIAERPATGSELANRLGIAPASVSEHAKVLRDAGLTTKHRVSNKVLHSITIVGAALLNGGIRPEPKVVDRTGT